MIRSHEELSKSGVQIITVFQSSQESIDQYVGKQVPPFPLACDPEENLYALYKLSTSWFGFFNPGNLLLFKDALKAGFNPGRMEGSISRIPDDFLIDESGKIHTAYYGNKIGDHINIDLVFPSLARTHCHENGEILFLSDRHSNVPWSMDSCPS